MVSFDFTWFHLISCEFTWFPLISYDFIWFHMISYGVLWFHMISCGFPWFHMVSFDFKGFPLISCDFIWFCDFIEFPCRGMCRIWSRSLVRLPTHRQEHHSSTHRIPHTHNGLADKLSHGSIENEKLQGGVGQIHYSMRLAEALSSFHGCSMSVCNKSLTNKSRNFLYNSIGNQRKSKEITKSWEINGNRTKSWEILRNPRKSH